jgi:hypothetical protein
MEIYHGLEEKTLLRSCTFYAVYLFGVTIKKKLYEALLVVYMRHASHCMISCHIDKPFL